MKIYKNVIKICSKASFVLLFLILWVTPTLAHKSPVTCSGSGLGISLYTNVQEVHIGDEIKYSVEVFNSANNSGTDIICDVTDIQVFIITPDDRRHPISLTRTALSNGQINTYSNIVTYTAQDKDLDNNILKATASVTGKIHQNDTDSLGGSEQGVNVTVIPPVPAPVVVPTPPPVVPIVTGGGGGGSARIIPLIGILKVPTPLVLSQGSGSVIYDYTVWNVGGQQALTSVTVKDDKCSPVVLLSGDVNNNSKLDTSERWKFSCTTILSITTTNTAIATGYSDDVYHQVATATATATVVVSVPILIQPPQPPIVPTPSFPKTGFPPEEKSNPWDIMMFLFLLFL